MKLNWSDTHKPMKWSWENWHTITGLLSVSVHWNLSQRNTQSWLDVYNGRPWARPGFSGGRWAALAAAHVLRSVCRLCFGPGWAIKAPKGCRNIMSSQQGQILNRKSLPCPRARLPDLFPHTTWNATLSANSEHVSDGGFFFQCFVLNKICPFYSTFIFRKSLWKLFGQKLSRWI